MNRQYLQLKHVNNHYYLCINIFYQLNYRTDLQNLQNNLNLGYIFFYIYLQLNRIQALEHFIINSRYLLDIRIFYSRIWSHIMRFNIQYLRYIDIEINGTWSRIIFYHYNRYYLYIYIYLNLNHIYFHMENLNNGNLRGNRNSLKNQAILLYKSDLKIYHIDIHHRNCMYIYLKYMQNLYIS